MSRGTKMMRLGRAGSACVLAMLVGIGSANAGECLMNHATYTEARSGAVLQFRPLQHEMETATANVFDLSFPNSKLVLPGDVTWSNGRRSLPYGTVRHECTQEEIDADFKDSTGLCSLWDGEVFALLDGDAAWIPYEDEPAPKGLLLPDFGDSLVQWASYYSVNPDGHPWDVFQLTGCVEGDK